jgi:hypothetical protein
MAGDIRFKHPFTCIVGGPTGSGKSTFCINFLQNLDTLCTEPEFAGGIVWCYSEQSAVPIQKLKALRNKNVQIRKGVPDDFKNTAGKPCLFILDDLLNEVFSRAVCDLFTRGSHHRNLSVILFTQNFFHKASHCRNISLNAKYLVALKNVRDRNQFSFLARQVLPENSASLCAAYRDATQNPHGSLILDFDQETDDLLRFRTNVFPHQYYPIIYARVNDEADKIQLSSSPSTQDGQTSVKKSYPKKLRRRAREIHQRVRVKRVAR